MLSRQRLILAVAAVAGALIGCGDELSIESVTSLPPGDALGTDLSGSYRVTLTTTDCSGNCPVTTIGLISIDVCRAGYSFEETAKVEQHDGRLEIKVPVGFYLTQMTGGIYQDGGFDVGGVSLQADGMVEVTARAQGQLVGGQINGHSRARGVGTYQGLSVNCTASYNFSGYRK